MQGRLTSLATGIITCAMDDVNLREEGLDHIVRANCLQLEERRGLGRGGWRRSVVVVVGIGHGQQLEPDRDRVGMKQIDPPARTDPGSS